MAGPGVGRAEQDPVARGAVADYLAAVAAQLRGPATARVMITDELRDGLLEGCQARGCSPQEAAAAAIASPALGLTVAATGRLSRRLGGGVATRATLT
jgi:hypothetical protein